MKKALFLILLLPFIGLSQTNLVRWSSSPSNTLDGTTLVSNITTAALSGPNVNLYSGNWGNMNAFNSSTYTNATTPNYSKYIQFQIGANSGYGISLTDLKYNYKVPQSHGVTKIQVRYSTNSSFPDNGTLIVDKSITQLSLQSETINLSGITVTAGTTLYIRVYPYARTQPWDEGTPFQIEHNQGGTVGPVIRGTVAVANPNPSAGNDSFTAYKNTATEFDVTSNDSSGSSGFGSIAVQSQPAHGAAIVTNGNKITYTPANNYIGSDSFTYKLTAANGNTSIATVSVNVLAVNPNAPLTGVLTVGTNGDFATITAAVAHLNDKGLSGNVTFSLINNAATKIYNQANGEVFPITLNPTYTGSTLYTVTFKPAAGKTVRVEANRPVTIGGYTGVPAVFKLNGTDNVIFDGSNSTNGTARNMVLVNSSYAGNDVHATGSNDYTDRAVIWIASNGSDGATNVTVKNVQIKQTYKNNPDRYCVGIYAGTNAVGGDNTLGTGEAAGAINNITINGNDFVNVKEGVFFNGGTTNISTNVNIFDNDLGSETNLESVLSPVSLNNVNTFKIYQNYIYKLYRDTNAASLATGGITINGLSRNGDIYQNDIKDLKRPTANQQVLGGIVLNSTYSENNNINVYNNFILDVSTLGNSGGYSNGYGIVIDNGKGYKIYHNTVVLTPASNQTSVERNYSAALYISAGVTALDVRNNIFVNRQTGANTEKFAIIVNSPSASTFAFLDYNNLYSSQYIGFYGTTAGLTAGNNPNYYPLFSGWQSASGKDANSKNVNPTFASATDLHINPAATVNTGILDNGTGAINTLVPKDIDGQIRKTNAPDMGADEWGAFTMPQAGNSVGQYCGSSTTFTGMVDNVAQWSNGNPSSTKDVIFAANYTQTGGTLEACSIWVLDGASVNFLGQSSAIVQHSVNVAETGASLTFEHDSHLIQVEDDKNTGIVTIKRKSGLLKRLDYTLWSSPVVDSRTTNYQSLASFSPATSVSPSRFYRYNTATDLYVVYDTPAQAKFEVGKAVLIRMPNVDATPGYNNGTTRIRFNADFIGTPNTGTIRIPLLSADGNLSKGYNAVGNPYPSPLNVNAFINENYENNGVMTGTLWVWRKTNDATQASYSTVNLTGYTKNAGGNDTDNTFVPVTGTSILQLNPGQGFIVQATAGNKELVFRNNMRENVINPYIFRTLNNNDDTAPQTVGNGRVWINAKNATGTIFSQVLVGYNDVTTLGYEGAYDGPSLMGGALNLYSLLPAEQETMKLAIQARGNFTEADVVPLGYSTTVAGTYEFEIDQADGIFAQGQDVYVKDNLLGTTQKLNNANYVFTTDAGTFDTRFQVVYVPQGELGTDNPVLDAKEVIVYRDAQQIKMTSPEDIETVTVYDMLGRVLFTQNNINGTEFSTPALSVAQQVVIVNVTLSNKQVVSKKIMMN